MFTRILFAIAGTIGSGITTTITNLNLWWTTQRSRAQNELFELVSEDSLTHSRLRILLLRGVNVSARDQSYWMPIERASYNGHITIVRMLLNAGVRVKESPGTLALKKALQNGHTDVAQLLRQYGATE